MGQKRTHKSQVPLYTKRQRLDADNNYSDHPSQYAALPGLDLPPTNALKYSDDPSLPDDPVAYLHHVRHQATQLPSLLNAETLELDDTNPSNNHSTNGQEAYYFTEGGTWVAAVPPSPSASTTSNSRIPAQQAYHASLLASYAHTHTRLSQPAPAHALKALKLTQPFIPSTERGWQKQFARLNPAPAFIASLQTHHVLEALKVLGQGHFVWRNMAGTHRSMAGGRNRRVQAWAWALLARLDYRTLGTEEVGVVREVGKRVVRILERAPARGKKVKKKEEEEEEEEREVIDVIVDKALKVKGPMQTKAIGLMKKWYEAHEGIGELCHRMAEAEKRGEEVSGEDWVKFSALVDTAVEEARDGKTGDAEQEDGNAAEPSPSVSTEDSGAAAASVNGEQEHDAAGPSDEIDDETASAYATYDMIVTVIGEVFGQRDLLTMDGLREKCWTTVP